MIELTMSPLFFFKAATACARVTDVCDMTSSMSVADTPSSSGEAAVCAPSAAPAPTAAAAAAAAASR
jgi:hypothetical protein